MNIVTVSSICKHGYNLMIQPCSTCERYEAERWRKLGRICARLQDRIIIKSLMAAVETKQQRTSK